MDDSIAPGKATKSNSSGEWLTTLNASGIAHTAAKDHRGSAPVTVRTSTSGTSNTTFGSASLALVRKKTRTSAVVFVSRSSRPPSPRRNASPATISAGIQTMPTSHHDPGSSSGSRHSLRLVESARPPVRTK